MMTADDLVSQLDTFDFAGCSTFVKQKDIAKILKKFARAHVKAALKQAAENISPGPSDSMEECILLSYPLKNIK